MLEQPNSVSLWSTSATGIPGSRGQLYTLFKQAITPLHHFHRKKGEISPSCDSQEEILRTGKGLREEVIKAPSSRNKKSLVILTRVRNWTAAFSSQLDFIDVFLFEST